MRRQELTTIGSNPRMHSMSIEQGTRLFRAGPRQHEVLSHLARGLTDSEIALQLGIKVPTVRTYLARLYKDNGFGNRTEAAVAWREWVTSQDQSRSRLSIR
jgi:DNA-binding CsgD family transcriptional regulator